jgi:hypothetical protein
VAVKLADALEKSDWSGVSIGNKVMLKSAIEILRSQTSRIKILQNLVKEYKARNREVLRQENNDVFPGFRGNNDGG